MVLQELQPIHIAVKSNFRMFLLYIRHILQHFGVTMSILLVKGYHSLRDSDVPVQKCTWLATATSHHTGCALWQ